MLTRIVTRYGVNWMIMMILVTANVVVVQVQSSSGNNGIHGLGVNWGTIASHPLAPNVVVQMLKDNGITKIKLFEADPWTLNFFAGSGIEVMVGIPNDRLKHMADKYSHAKDWVKENVTKLVHDGGVDIKYVAVGNEAFLSSYNGSYHTITLPAMQNIQKALDEAGVGDKVKVTTPLNADVYESSSNKPSGGNFRNDIKDVMIQIVKFLRDNKSPFVVNIYPFLSLYQNKDFPFDFTFFDGNSDKTITDNNLTYTNVFDANYDTLVWTLKKVGVPELKIVVGEVGWPTDGNIFANVKLAKRFYNGLLKKLAANKGTPLRPDNLDVYLFGLVDEDQKSVAPGFFERHWGIFRYDGQPKFSLDLSGQGRSDKELVPAKGVVYLPKQWCVLSNKADMNLVPNETTYACSLADCTSLTYGSSCNGLDDRGNVSYAFNMYYQMSDQDAQACDFNGLATLVQQNLSSGNCLFPVQIVLSEGKKLGLGYYGVKIVVGFVLGLFIF